MRTVNADKLRNAFADSAIVQTIAFEKERGIYVRNESVYAFANLIGQMSAGDADERIFFETIKIDGPLAIAWTSYVFYYKGNLSHCGVNSFQLLRINNAWKIQYLIDTRRKSGCNISAK